jgi:predicted nucleotide-binding protein
MTEIEDDASAVLAALIPIQDEGLRAGGARQYEYIPATKLAQVTGFADHRVGFAVEFLEQRGYADVLRTFGEGLTGTQLRATTSGRVAYQRESQDALAALAGAHDFSGRRVFIVHGRDESAREKVARMLEQLELEPVILQEQASQGLTLIEKFEQHAEGVVFAVVILTPDDWARGADEEDWPDEPNRARQNVILEMGYFMSALGRSRVAALLGDGTEAPSDIHGVVYIRLDADGAWRLLLGRELKAAGIDVNLNRLA